MNYYKVYFCLSFLGLKNMNYKMQKVKVVSRAVVSDCLRFFDRL